MNDERSPDLTQALLLELRAQLEEARRERDEAQEQILADARERLLEHGSDEDAEQLRRERDATRAAVAEWMDECAERTIAAEQGVRVAEALAAEKAALAERVGVLSAALERLHAEARGVVTDGGCCPFCGISRHEDCQQHSEDCAVVAARAALEVEP